MNIESALVLIHSLKKSFLCKDAHLPAAQCHPSQHHVHLLCPNCLHSLILSSHIQYNIECIFFRKR